jgi:aminoglycoside phosphotransferase
MDRTMNEAASALTSPQAAEILAVALGCASDELESWAIADVHARPGAETSVTYDVSVAGTRVHLVASTIDLDESARDRAHAVRLDAEIGRLHVWSYPNDPALPALAAACVPASVEALLSAGMGRSVQVLDLEIKVYRPLRRAVLRVEMRVGQELRTAFIKVVRPAKSAQVASRHSMMPSGLGPRCTELGQGLLLVESAPGVPLMHVLAQGQGEGSTQRLPRPQELLRLLDRLPAAAMDLPARPSITSRVDKFASAALDLGLDASRVKVLFATIVGLVGSAAAVPVTTHGDFNVGNIFVGPAMDDGSGLTLIDLDTMGPGSRVDDLADLLAHLAVAPTFDPGRSSLVTAYVAELLEAFDREVDPVVLRARTAAVLLSLAACCTDVTRAQAWLALSEAWAYGAAARMRAVS